MLGSQVRRPRGLVKINGQAMPSWLAWDWNGNSLYQADTFSADLALSGMPAGRDGRWWSEQGEIEVELFAGFPADAEVFGEGDLTSMFVGFADEVEVEWETNVVRLTGRDRTAAFTDNKTSEKFPNQTASQIASTLAARRGLTAAVKATSTRVGKYYKDTRTRLEDDRTEWDLLTWLAREEGFVVYVKGRELHFEPPATRATYTVERRGADQGVTPSGDFVRLRTSRVLTVANDITVTVRSWNSKEKKAFVRKATRKKGQGQHVQQYSYTIPGLTPEQAQQRANQLLAELSRHEMKLQLDGPADNVLGKADLITLTGTDSAFDQTYFPDTVHRSLDFEGGYRWAVTAKNHSPESQPSL